MSPAALGALLGALGLALGALAWALGARWGAARERVRSPDRDRLDALARLPPAVRGPRESRR